MKFYILVLLFISSFVSDSEAQLNIKPESSINATHESVTAFITNNNFKYALVTWSTSTWIAGNNEFSGIFRQNKKWYLAKIISNKYPKPKDPSIISIKEKELTKQELKSLFSDLEIDSTFLYNQTDLDKVPDSCSYTKDGKKAGLLFMYDASTYHLIQVSKGKTNSLKFYVPKEFFEKCYPYVEEFGILKGLINTSDNLKKTARTL